MSQCSSRLVHVVARALHPDEREAVLGDCIELEMSPAQTCREIAGLALRRQVCHWMRWRPWIALVGMLLPLGLVLSHVSRQWADTATIYAWLYVNNWTTAFLESPGARQDLLDVVGGLLVCFGTLASWSFIAGFAVGRLSRATIWFSATAFCVVVFTATTDTTTLARANSYNALAFRETFYRLILPSAVRIACVVLPALVGMAAGHRSDRLSCVRWAVAFIAVSGLTSLAAPSLERSLDTGRLAAHAISARNAGPRDTTLDVALGPPHSWIRRWALPALMVWPAGYLVATSHIERRRSLRCTVHTART